MTIVTAIIVVVGLTIGVFAFEVIFDKRNWRRAVGRSTAMAIVVVVFAANNRPTTVLGVLLIVASLVAGNYIFEFAFNTRRWNHAAECSCFMVATAMICILITAL